MDLSRQTEENLQFMLKELTKYLEVANHSLFDVNHYDLAKYNDIKSLYEMIVNKGKLTAMETQAFIEELRSARK